MSEFYAKLSDVQARLKAPKSQYNSFGKYKYRSCEDILEAVKPLLQESGLVLTLSDSVTLTGDRVHIEATATLTDGKESLSVSGFAREALTKKGMDDSQITGCASSYARKYALNGLFCIDDTEDADVPEDKVSEKQISQLEDLINEYNVDRVKFLAWAGVDSVENIPSGKFKPVLAALKAKASQ